MDRLNKSSLYFFIGLILVVMGGVAFFYLDPKASGLPLGMGLIALYMAIQYTFPVPTTIKRLPKIYNSKLHFTLDLMNAALITFTLLLFLILFARLAGFHVKLFF